MNERNERSFLEIYDLRTGKVTTVKEFDDVIEAPNWTQDGKSLIYNTEGHLRRVDLVTGGDTPIDTGLCDNCNNDHVLSPDGRSIAVSHMTFPDGGFTSRIYIVPFDGGAPRLVAEHSPSFLHGWSPDGQTMAYCAFRDEKNGGDIYTVNAAGGEETRLTSAPGLNDGPEYSPDGRHIWFNSVRTGLMQVWRMNADGSEQTQMTFDEDRNSWFPHVSPDGRKVVYLAYRKGDLEPGEHLPGKQVELKLMDAAGGAATTLVSFYGGQGTINVNSWAPDSERFAYVRYAPKG